MNAFRKLRIAFIAFFSTFLISSFAFGQNPIVTPAVVLNDIKQVSSTGERNDELYFLIADLHAKKKAFYTIPGNQDYFGKNRLPQPSAQEAYQYHHHWKDTYLDRVKNVTLWQRLIPMNKGTQLIITLIEADAPPYNLDDALGTLKIRLFYKDGVLKAQITPDQYAKVISQKIVNSNLQVQVKVIHGKANYEFTLTMVGVPGALEK